MGVAVLESNDYEFSRLVKMEKILCYGQRSAGLELTDKSFTGDRVCGCTYMYDWETTERILKLVTKKIYVET